MAWGAGSGVRRAIDEQYFVGQRAASLRWMAVNAALLLTFSLDLWYACPGYRSALHYVEGALACAAAASAARHAARLLRAPPRAPPRDPPRATPCTPPAPPLDLSPALRWRRESPASSAEVAPRTPPDAAHLDRYLTAAPAPVAAWSDRAPPPPYQVSPLRAEPAAVCVRAGGAAPEAWRRVCMEPARLARFELDLRRWLHATVLERLARELDATDAELAAAGLEVRLGAASVARLEELAAATPGSLGERLRQLLPFLRPFAEQEYVMRRVRALARGPSLPGYRWDGGGAGWDGARHPPDAELLLRLLAAYLDSVVPAAGGGAFSAAHVQWGGAPVRGPGVLALHLGGARPPHLAVVAGEEVLEPEGGRTNLPAALLLFLAAAARREPPALLRLHLGPAGLNMLWMLEP